MTKLYLWVWFAPLFLFAFSSDNPAVSYIETYKAYAVVEMHRSGIPASITLAQGLHETGNGTSELANFANNHFGIKCKSYWTGGKYYYEDDDYNKKGELMKSCFRVYSSPLDSYIDHSNFLMNSERYDVLFQYDRTDYKSWAKGLRACGYSTDPKYAEKLINKIEKFGLAQFDNYQLKDIQ